MNSALKYIATLGFIGYLPYAPGTWGTVVALFTFIILQPSVALHVLIVMIIIPVGILSAHRAEILLQERDSRRIVIDEFSGYFCAVLLIPFSISASLAAFFLFRLFDILKPFPIRMIESSLGGGIGVMADDIMAGLYTNILLRILLIVNPGIFSSF